tara:strand:+ start:3423 stop:3974 length:552 start_codon:yes stop_codon:yes gene_type:complete
MNIYSALFFVTTISGAFSFVPTAKPDVTSFKYLGDIAPTKYFDPLLLTSNLSDDKIKYVREAELQHGRVAMLSFIGLLGLDFVQDNLAINFLYDQGWEVQLPFWFGTGCYEFSRMGAGWKNPFVEGENYFKLEDHYQPGNVLKVDINNITEERFNRELSNGRLAMLGCLGYIAHEYLFQTQIF